MMFVDIQFLINVHIFPRKWISKRRMHTLPHAVHDQLVTVDDEWQNDQHQQIGGLICRFYLSYMNSVDKHLTQLSSSNVDCFSEDCRWASRIQIEIIVYICHVSISATNHSDRGDIRWHLPVFPNIIHGVWITEEHIWHFLGGDRTRSTFATVAQLVLPWDMKCLNMKSASISNRC